MRVVSRRALVQYWEMHPDARASLDNWYRVVVRQQWGDFTALRATFPSADQVKVASGKTVVVFNVGGNNIRLVGAVHYNTGMVFVLAAMTHVEYSKNRWQDRL